MVKSPAKCATAENRAMLNYQRLFNGYAYTQPVRQKTGKNEKDKIQIVLFHICNLVMIGVNIYGFGIPDCDILAYLIFQLS